MAYLDKPKPMWRYADTLRIRGADPEFIRWVVSNKGDEYEAWEACPRADWLLYMYSRHGEFGWGDPFHRSLVLAAVDCAAMQLTCIPAGEKRPARALQAAREWAEASVYSHREAKMIALPATSVSDAVRAAYHAASAAEREGLHRVANAARAAAVAAETAVDLPSASFAYLAATPDTPVDIVRRHLRCLPPSTKLRI